MYLIEDKFLVFGVGAVKSKLYDVMFKLVVVIGRELGAVLWPKSPSWELSGDEQLRAPVGW